MSPNPNDAEARANAIRWPDPQERAFEVGFENVRCSVRRERLRQNTKFSKTRYGHQSLNLHVWNTVLGEEVGEVSNALLELTFSNLTDVPNPQAHVIAQIAHLRDELVQVAAVAFAIIERIDAKDRSLSHSPEALVGFVNQSERDTL